MPVDDTNPVAAGHGNWTRRRALQVAAAAGAALSADAWSASEPAATSGATAAGRRMMFDIDVRIPAGKLAAWERFWGEENVPALEANGQWLWGAWSSLTGPQDTVTHEWAYRDLAQFQEMERVRSSNAQVLALRAKAVPIEETVVSSVMSPLPYHPADPYVAPVGPAGIIVTHRLLLDGTASTTDHSAMAAEYVTRAVRHGAQLVGAYQSYFGWTPKYQLQVWRYPGYEQYLRVRQAIEADPKCQQLLAGMRALFPHESVDLHQPMSYSRIR